MDIDYSDFVRNFNIDNKWQAYVDTELDINNNPVDYVETSNVNHPPHYTSGKYEAINIIEDAIKDASDPVDGMLQAQVLKYMLRLWLKDNPKEDAEKARWYLNRLIEKL